MSKNYSQNKDQKKNIKRKKIRWLFSIITILTITIVSYLWYESSKDVNDLSLIGKGENVIVQVHDPG